MQQENKKKKLPETIRRFIPFDFWWIVGILGQVVPITFLMYGINTLLLVFIPLTGRLDGIRSDILIAFLVSVGVQLLATLFYPFVYRVGNFGKTIVVVAVGCLLVFLIGCFLFPYSDSYPLRINAIHTWDLVENRSTIEINFLSSPPYEKAVQNLEGIARINGVWIIQDVSHPEIPPPYIVFNQTTSSFVTVHVYTYNATRWSMHIKSSIPLLSIYISQQEVIPTTDEKGYFTLIHQLGFQSWSDYNEVPVVFGLSTKASNTSDSTIEIDFEARCAESSLALDKIIKQLPSYTAQTSSFLTRMTSSFTFNINLSLVDQQ